MKTERIVQALFYLLLIIVVLGNIGYDNGTLIPPDIRNVLIYVILAFIVGFLIYYYLTKKKKR